MERATRPNDKVSLHRVEVDKILKGSLDMISSPSVKIQIMGEKGVKAKHCWALSTSFRKQKVC